MPLRSFRLTRGWDASMTIEGYMQTKERNTFSLFSLVFKNQGGRRQLCLDLDYARTQISSTPHNRHRLNTKKSRHNTIEWDETILGAPSFPHSAFAQPGSAFNAQSLNCTKTRKWLSIVEPQISESSCVKLIRECRAEKNFDEIERELQGLRLDDIPLQSERPA